MNSQITSKISVATNLENARPTLVWWISSDADSDALTYQLQAAPDGDWGSDDLIQASGIAPSGLPYIAYTVEENIQTNRVYAWRVRAYDGYEYSAWSNELAFIYSASGDTESDFKAKVNVTYPSNASIGAKIETWQHAVESSDLSAKIGIYSHDDLTARVNIGASRSLGAQARLVRPWLTNFYSKVRVLPYKDLPSSLYIIPYRNLNSKISIPPCSNIDATILIPPYKDISASINVIPYRNLAGKIRPINCSDLGAKLNVTGYQDLHGSVYVSAEYQKLYASVRTCHKDWAGLGAKFNLVGLIKGRLNIEVSGQLELSGKVNVCYAEASGLPATVNIIGHRELDAHIHIETVRDFYAKVDVDEDVPSTVVVTSDIAEATWQENDNPTFSWEDPYDPFYDVNEYYVAWNDDPDYVVSENDQRTNLNTISKYAFDAGFYYFHIRAVNTIGHWSLATAHYAIYYNRIPTPPSGLYLVEDQNDPIVGTVQPYFSWGNAVDGDQLDVLTYNLQIASNTSFAPQYMLRDITSIPEVANSSRTTYALPSGLKLAQDDQYFWRVRTFDSKQYGAFAETHIFTVVPTASGLSARITIPTYTHRNFQASVKIKSYKNIKGALTVHGLNTRVLGAKLNVVYKTDTDLDAKIQIYARRDIKAKTTILPYKRMAARLRVFGVYGIVNLPAKIKVCAKDSSDMLGKATVYHKSSGDAGGKVRIFTHRELNAKLLIYTPEHYGYLDEFGQDMPGRIVIKRKSVIDLQTRITTIADRPGIVPIECDIAADTWQNESVVTFTWREATYTFFPIAGYYTKIDRNPNTVVGETSQNTIGMERIIDLENLEGAGAYYFHVAAINTLNRFGPTSHFKVCYNHLPSTPTLPLYVNELDSYGGLPTVAKNATCIFSWGQAYDEDGLDSLTYTIQIATQEDFQFDQYGNASIVYSASGIPTFSYELAGGTLQSKTYYWRVKVYDGHQYSTAWSPVGNFRINTPPLVPTGLSVYRA